MTNLDHIEENLIDLTDSEKLNEILFEDGQNTIGLLYCLSFFSDLKFHSNSLFFYISDYVLVCKKSLSSNIDVKSYKNTARSKFLKALIEDYKIQVREVKL